MNKTLTVITLLVSLFLTACKPPMASMIVLPTEGSPQLVQGIRDGCETAHSSRGNSYHRTFYKFTQDVNQMNDDEYFDSWYRGYIWCFHIVNAVAFSAVDGSLYVPHETFWNKEGGNSAKLSSPSLYEQGVPTPWGGKIKMIGEGETWWDTMFKGCKGVLQC